MVQRDRTRHERMRSMLPRIYATEPGTVLGAMLDAIGDRLGDLDGDLERGLRDKWLFAAKADRPWGIELAPPRGWQRDAAIHPRAAQRVDAWAKALRRSDRLRLAPRDGSLSVALFDLATIVPTLPLVDLPRIDEAAARERLDELLAPLVPGERLRGDRLRTPLVSGTTSGQRFIHDLHRDGLEIAWVPVQGGSSLILCSPSPSDGQLRAALDELLRELAGVSAPGEAGLRGVSFATPRPLELLGAALDLPRFAWEVDVDHYRRRVTMLAPLLAGGLATHRAIANFALTTLASEPCPLLERSEDLTLAYGLAPGRRRRCASCRDGRLAPAGPCSMRGESSLRVRVIDNPRTRARIERHLLGHGDLLAIHSESLFAAHPTLRITLEPSTAASMALRFIALRSETTGEQMIVPRPLLRGEILHIEPASNWIADLPRHAQVWVDPPEAERGVKAEAWIERAGGDLQLEHLVLAEGSRFNASSFAAGFPTARYDDARFDADAFDPVFFGLDEAEGGRFTGAEFGIVPPRLPPGDSSWQLELLDLDAYRAAIDDLGQGREQAERELDALLVELAGAFDPDALAPSLAIELEWWTRPPNRFALEIPRTPAVEALLERGAGEQLRQMIERVRPIGVIPRIDFARLPLVEELEPEDALIRVVVRTVEAIEPLDAPPRSALRLREELSPDDRAGWHGLFDETWFDESRFDLPTP